MEKLPVWQTAMDALDYTWQERRSAARYGIIPLALEIVTAWLLLWFDVDPDQPSAPLILASLIGVFIYLPPTVAWYRTVVYGQAAGQRPMFSFTRLEMRLLLWQIGVSLLIAVGAGLCGLAIAIVGFVVRTAAGDVAAWIVITPLVAATIVAVAVIGNRLAMTFALAALDKPVSLRTAWEITAHIAWRFTGAVALVIAASLLLWAGAELLVWLMSAGIALTAGGTLPTILPYGHALAEGIAGLFGLFALATVFGIVYKTRENLIADIAAPTSGDTPPAN